MGSRRAPGVEIAAFPLMSSRDECPVAVLLIDVINAFDFEGSEGLVRAAEQAAPHIDALRTNASKQGVPVIYVNDNFGKWRSDFRATFEACIAAGKPGRRVSQRLEPTPDDYFVLKPRHSGFFCTALELLLERLDARTLVLAGFATNICVLFTAHDARMRGYRILVPSDCTASNSPELTTSALQHMETVLEASTATADRVDFQELMRR